MQIYEFLFFDPKGGVPALDLAHYPDDDSASRAARALLAEHAGCLAVDVYDRDRLVMRLEKPADAVRPVGAPAAYGRGLLRLRRPFPGPSHR